jgi:urease accessory protein
VPLSAPAAAVAAETPAYFAREPWRARLELRLECAPRSRVTRLVHNRHSGPLRVQKPFYPEGAEGPCQLLLVHPPGGLASGDRLAIDVALGAGTALVASTPGAGKWYRSFGHAAEQTVDLTLDDDAVLEWLPQEAIVFDGAQARAATRVRLAASAGFLGWDIVAFGRRAGDEPYRDGSYRAGFDLEAGGRRLWCERAHVDGGSALLDSPVGLAGRRVAGTLIASTAALRIAPAARVDAGPAAPGPARAALDALRTVDARAYGDELLAGATLLPAGLVLRALASEPERLRAYFAQVRRLLRPLLFGRPAVDPRIWNT